MSKAPRFLRRTPLVLSMLFLAWVAFLAVRSGVSLSLTPSEQNLARRLDRLNQILLKHVAFYGEYPSTGGRWMLVGSGSSPGEGEKSFPAGLSSAPPFTDPDKAPSVSIIYASDGHDYKLLAHVADRRLCVAARNDSPSLVDPARTTYAEGFLRGPGWTVQGAETARLEEAMAARGNSPPGQDAGLHRFLRATCWSFGYWSPGAASW